MYVIKRRAQETYTMYKLPGRNYCHPHILTMSSISILMKYPVYQYNNVISNGMSMKCRNTKPARNRHRLPGNVKPERETLNDENSNSRD